MSVRMNKKLGAIVIDSNVIATYAGSVAVECFGIVGMASVSMKDGLVKLLGRENLGHGITVRLNENRIELDFHVACCCPRHPGASALAEVEQGVC